MDQQPHRAHRIQFETRDFHTYPAEMEAEVPDDSYLLLAPLRRTTVRVVSSGRVLMDGDVKPGMLRVAEPGERSSISLRAPARHLIVSIPSAEMRSILDRVGYTGSGPHRHLQSLTRPDGRIAHVARTALAGAGFAGVHRQLYFDGLAYSMLACLLAEQTANRVTSTPDRKGLTRQQLDRCCEYAEESMEKPLDLPAWAATLGMTGTEFSRRFRQTAGQAPYAWFMDRRIDRAKTILQGSTTAIAEVALSVGFCSQSHFTEAFRRRVNCSPGRWRAERS